MNNKITIIYTTIANKEAGEQLAKQAVSENLAACVNIIPNITSVYKWEGKIETGNEYILIFKTAYNNKDILTKWLLENHPYDVPAIIAGKPDTTPDFLQFIEDNSQCLGN